MQPQADAVPLDPADAPLALGDNAVFFEELIRRLAEGLFRCEEASAVFPAQLKISILSDLFGEGQALLFRAASALFAAD